MALLFSAVTVTAGEACALPGFVDSKNDEKPERNAGYLVVSHSGGGMLRQGTRKGIRSCLLYTSSAPTARALANFPSAMRLVRVSRTTTRGIRPVSYTHLTSCAALLCR